MLTYLPTLVILLFGWRIRRYPRRTTLSRMETVRGWGFGWERIRSRTALECIVLLPVLRLQQMWTAWQGNGRWFFQCSVWSIIHVDPNILREFELHGSCYNDTRAIIEVKEQKLKKQKRVLDKLHELYEENMITKQVFLERKAVRSRQVQKLEEELKDMRKVVSRWRELSNYGADIWTVRAV